MIVLLGCSINLLANNDDKYSNLSTGGVVGLNDSVRIAYDDIRIVNTKLIELEYQRKINSHLKNIVHNDSIIIKDYQDLNTNLNKDCKKYIHQKNIAIGTTAFFIISSIVLFLK